MRLPDEDVEFLDQYAQTQGFGSRCAASIRRGLFAPPALWAITGSALVVGPVVNGVPGWGWMAFVLAGSPMAPAALWIAPVVALWANRPAVLLAIPIALVSVGRRALTENEGAVVERPVA